MKTPLASTKRWRETYGRGTDRDATGGVVLLQAAVALAGDDDERVWWPAVAQDDDQLATHGPGGEEELRVRVRVRACMAGRRSAN